MLIVSFHPPSLDFFTGLLPLIHSQHQRNRSRMPCQRPMPRANFSIKKSRRWKQNFTSPRGECGCHRWDGVSVARVSDEFRMDRNRGVQPTIMSHSCVCPSVSRRFRKHIIHTRTAMYQAYMKWSHSVGTPIWGFHPWWNLSHRQSSRKYHQSF